MEKKEKDKFLSEKLLFSSEIISLETINSSLFSLNEQTLLLKNYLFISETTCLLIIS
jgi:hypothetical protein